MVKVTISSVMKGQNPFPALLTVLLVVSLGGAQQLQRGFVAAQGRPGASAVLHRERGSVRTDGGAVVGGVAFRTQQQPFRPVNRAQVLQRANKITTSPQEVVAIGQQRVTLQPTQPVTTTQRVVTVANQAVPVTVPQQQQVINEQQRIVQIPAAQPQQVTPSQQRPQAIRFQQQPVTQRVVQIPGSQVTLGQQRVVQSVSSQQPVSVVPQQTQQFSAPVHNNRDFPQSNLQATTRGPEESTGFTQDTFPNQGNVGVAQAIPTPSPLPVQRKRVRKQKVKTNDSGIGTFQTELTEDELEARRELEEILAEQARNARYSFASTVDDGLNDQTVSRQETREGLLTKGSYSYSDGFFQRTVHYEADENGYRVTSQNIQAIGDGPQPDPNGTAHVSNQFGNAHNEYAITAADLAPAQEENINESI